MKCEICLNNRLQVYNAIVSCPNCGHSLWPDQYIGLEIEEEIKEIYDDIYGKGEYRKIIKKYKEHGMPVRKEFKLSEEYYVDWSDLADLVIGNYDKNAEGTPIKKPRIHCASFEGCIKHLLQMPTINEIQVNNIDQINKSLKKMEEKYDKLMITFQEGIEEALRSRIQELEDEIVILKERKVKKFK